MIPLTNLYNEYIDRPKLTEQKKPAEYIVPPPTTSGFGTIKQWKEKKDNFLNYYYKSSGSAGGF